MAAAFSSSLWQTQSNISILLPPSNSLAVKFGCSYPNFRPRKLCNVSVNCCLNFPLEPQSSVGKSLNSILQNQRTCFYDAVSMELNQVVEDREAAFARFNLSLGSDEASLHRRIAKLKEAESQLAVEDALYMIILYNFSNIRVPLVPTLSKCLYKGRLEILPSKDYELESIHSSEVLEMVKEHLGTAVGWKAGSSVSVNWSPTNIRRHHLSQVYAASILYGYFLKSASRRLCLEHNVPSTTFQNFPFGSWTSLIERASCGFENVTLGPTTSSRSTAMSQVTKKPRNKEANLKCYVMGFDVQTMEQCAKLRSKEAVELIDKHCSALFGDDNVESNDLILTSLSSLKRLVLEAVAFGCFLWEAEEYVSRIYELKN
ncbi:UV-B-induced protein At3g17800, chloroplastic-like [Amaranthus tricolor]|uniref:UV-B-induced protein At3g17800, chloroplastic-like n=1 Tax=Amaranthus tricolor TaxID=29722 RepID=UPI00258B56EB|nr:UV-B-induced protein At3g17800, chloroplastic-like [Amaranthus tricolor]